MNAIPERKPFRLSITPVDHDEALAQPLPGDWAALIESGFHPDLVLRAACAQRWCALNQEHMPEHELVEPMRLFLERLAEGFGRRFDSTSFREAIEDDDEHRELKLKALDAIDELAEFYGNRVPDLLWTTLAFISAREAPTEDRSIIVEVQQSALPEHYTFLDACLHALGKVYSLNFHVASIFSQHTGFVPIHNCDCGCSLHSLAPAGGGMNFEMPRANVVKATESFLTHVLAELVALAGFKIPFEFGVGDDAAAALAIEREGL